MTLSSLVGALGGSALLLAAIRVIFATGKIVKGQEQLQESFDTHRHESRASMRELDGKLADHGTRILTLELMHDLGGDRRHLLRRNEDQVVRDVRKMVNGEDL